MSEPEAPARKDPKLSARTVMPESRVRVAVVVPVLGPMRFSGFVALPSVFPNTMAPLPPQVWVPLNSRLVMVPVVAKVRTAPPSSVKPPKVVSVAALGMVRLLARVTLLKV